MAFTPFDAQDFGLMSTVQAGQPLPPQLKAKINDLRRELGQYPEYQLGFFSKRIVRRPNMRGDGGLVFGPARPSDQHWFLYVVGGDGDEVQLNIGMWPDYIRVGLGFQIGRTARPKIPAFRVFQTFLGVRPPLPFREAFYRCVEKNRFGIEDIPTKDADEVLYRLETFVVPADDAPVFVFVGALWNV
ncbi:MAG: hypothetical protein K6U74_11445, partial [Firmicutes bacterium]|nr:hypothetical protein [Bacillota bacterium]